MPIKISLLSQFSWAWVWQQEWKHRNKKKTHTKNKKKVQSDRNNRAINLTTFLARGTEEQKAGKFR